MIILDRSDGSCNTAEDSVGRKCVPNKIEEVNLKVFNMIKGKNESKTIKHTSGHKDVYVMVESVIQNKNRITISVSVSVKTQ